MYSLLPGREWLSLWVCRREGRQEKELQAGAAENERAQQASRKVGNGGSSLRVRRPVETWTGTQRGSETTGGSLEAKDMKGFLLPGLCFQPESRPLAHC